MIVAFTGPTRLYSRQRQWLGLDAAHIKKADEFRTGAALGVDTIMANALVTRWAKARHVLYVPDAPCNDEFVSWWGHEIVNCPRRTTLAAAYRARNEYLVKGEPRRTSPQADLLIAYVHHPEFYRSGEWMTVNIAKKAGVEVDFRVLP